MRMGVAKAFPIVARRDTAARSGGRDDRRPTAAAVVTPRGVVVSEGRLLSTELTWHAPG